MYATPTDCFTKLKTIFQNGNTHVSKSSFTKRAGTQKKAVPKSELPCKSMALPLYSFTQRTIMPLAVENFRSLRSALCVGFCLLNQKAKQAPSAVQL